MGDMIFFSFSDLIAFCRIFYVHVRVRVVRVRVVRAHVAPVFQITEEYAPL